MLSKTSGLVTTQSSSALSLDRAPAPAPEISPKDRLAAALEPAMLSYPCVVMMGADVKKISASKAAELLACKYGDHLLDFSSLDNWDCRLLSNLKDEEWAVLGGGVARIDLPPSIHAMLSDELSNLLGGMKVLSDLEQLTIPADDIIDLRGLSGDAGRRPSILIDCGQSEGPIEVHVPAGTEVRATSRSGRVSGDSLVCYYQDGVRVELSVLERLTYLPPETESK